MVLRVVFGGVESCSWCLLVLLVGQSAVSLHSASLFSSSNCESMGRCCVRDEATGALLTARDQVSLSWAQAAATDGDNQLQSGIAAACRSTTLKTSVDSHQHSLPLPCTLTLSVIHHSPSFRQPACLLLVCSMASILQDSHIQLCVSLPVSFDSN